MLVRQNLCKYGILVLFLGLGGARFSFAQAADALPRWSVRIYLKSAAHGPAVGLRIVLDHLQSGLTFETRTDAQGIAHLALPEGPYTARVFAGKELVMVRRLEVRPQAQQQFVWTLPRSEAEEVGDPESLATDATRRAPASKAVQSPPENDHGSGSKPPSDPKTAWKAALAAVEARDFAAALPLWASYLKAHPRDPHALFNMGLTLVHLGRCEEALDYFDQVLEVDPQATPALQARAECYQLLERWTEAEKVYRVLTERFPQEILYWFNLGVCAYQRGDEQAARRAWERVLLLAPESVEANLVRSWLEQLGKGETPGA